MNMRSISLLSLFALALSPSIGRAQEACDVAEPMSAQRWLRRLSLDLEGVVPNRVEIEEQAGLLDVPEDAVDRMLDSDGFLEVMRAHHASLLWPNIEQVDLVDQTHVLIPQELSPGNVVWWSPLRAVFTRAAPGAGALYIPCKNEPAQFDAEGRPIVEPVMQGETVIGYQEGYVEVVPYWPVLDSEGLEIVGATIKVCAIDAQDAPFGTVCPGPEDRYPFLEPTCQQIDANARGAQVQAPFRDGTAACDGPMVFFAPDCGCGPNLRYCQTPETGARIKASLMEQQLRIVDRIIQNGRPYHEILTDQTLEYDGPAAHYLRHQARLNLDLFANPDEATVVPVELEYRDIGRWIPMERSGRHSGVLTAPGYLLRFTSNRGRAHRFYNAFECSSFIPAGPLPSPFEACSKHEDLTKRCGCNACHQALEPMAAHWGRFAEFGYGELDEQRFPRQVGSGAFCRSDIESLFRCSRLYELDPVGEEADYVGYLNAYVFRSEEEWTHIEQGPARLARSSVDSGRFAACTVSRMWTYFMRREPTPEEQSEVLAELVTDLEQHDYDLKRLVKQIVQQPAYRRLP